MTFAVSPAAPVLSSCHSCLFQCGDEARADGRDLLLPELSANVLNQFGVDLPRPLVLGGIGVGVQDVALVGKAHDADRLSRRGFERRRHDAIGDLPPGFREGVGIDALRATLVGHAGGIVEDDDVDGGSGFLTRQRIEAEEPGEE